MRLFFTEERRSTRSWFLIYVLSSLLILALGILALIELGPSARNWLFRTTLPEGWEPVIEDLTSRLFVDELRAFFVTSGFGLSIVVIGVTLFPLKERLSLAYEQEAFPGLSPTPAPPLWRQALQEGQLLWLYLVFQGMGIYLILQGYPRLGLAVNVLYLILAMTLDHCAPFFQRRDLSLKKIVWLLLRYRPLKAFLIGLVCIGPVIILEKTLPREFAALLAITLLVLSEVLGMAIATVAGCGLAARLAQESPELLKQDPPKLWSFGFPSWVAFLSIGLLVFISWWMVGLHRIVSFRKARFAPQWSEAQLMIRGEALQVRLPIRVENRGTEDLDPTQLSITITGGPSSDLSLTGPLILGGEKKNLNLTFTMELPMEEMAQGNFTRLLSDQYAAEVVFHPPLSKKISLPLF